MAITTEVFEDRERDISVSYASCDEAELFLIFRLVSAKRYRIFQDLSLSIVKQ